MDLKAKENEGDQDSIYKSLITQEKQHRAGQRSHHAMGKVQTGLTHVELNTTTGKEETTENKYMEYACHDDNRRNFSQTSNNPLIHGRISQEVGFYCESES